MKEKNRKQAFEGEGRNKSAKRDKKAWEKPTLEDVSDKVMAQPYIRFT